MIAKIVCYALNGLEGVPVEVETDVNKGVPAYEMVGLPDTAVKESKERVRSAIKNSGMLFPMNKITINFAPADLKKEGASFDLAIAISLLKASEQLIGADVKDVVFLGELALNGDLRPIGGLLPILISAKGQGYKKFVIPTANAKEARFLGGAEIYPVHSLAEVVKHLAGTEPIKPLETAAFVVR
ncbi:MAG: magnesium chelatase, partial [Clostridiales bacterium]|nr:magnesium chelatase [Clostridiales bacterium]